MSRRVELNENALVVLEKRYLLRDSSGKIVETPDELFARVSTAVASVEKRDRAKWSQRFRELMTSRRFLPNSPTLMNAGKKKGQLSACFVLPIEDSLDAIFETLKQTAKIHQSGGGTGFAFSRLRPHGSVVQSTSGVASGPVSFIRIFDTATETIKQGGTRRGANMAVLRVDHPDIEEFIDAKRDMRSILNFNVSVGATDEFMSAVSEGRKFSLLDPATRKAVKEVDARALFERMTQAAWECGDPGLVFLDRINRFNPTPNEGPMESTNPCGEQPLLPYESCNLGSLNLGLFVGPGGFFDWKRFEADIVLATRFLDNVIDANHFPVDACEKITLRNRKIGLGVMGLADALLMMSIPYDSPGALEFGERVASFIDRVAKRASAALAVEKGAFKNFPRSMWKALGYPALRNATVSTVAPTGTISIIAGASSGIEPLFSGVFYRNVLSGERLVDVHPSVARVLELKGLTLEGLTDERIARELGPAWRPSGAVSVRDHVKMQAVFQRHSDSAVSKTINLPFEAKREDVAEAYRLAFDLGCKGITVYRDRSRPNQVLDKPADQAPASSGGDASYCPSC